MCERRIFIFTGSSLHPDKARTLIDAIILPPIKRGDLASVSASKPQVVGIIDGEFYQSLAVSPKEILPLLEAGVRVYGAASMGALRAVELRKFGMVGVGRVFRLFRAGFLDADDEVAVTFDPSTYQPTSEPLVNTRYLMRAAVRHRLSDRGEAAEILAEVKAAYFPERTKGLLHAIARARLGADRAGQLHYFAQKNAIDVKQQDALALLHAIAQEAISS